MQLGWSMKNAIGCAALLAFTSLPLLAGCATDIGDSAPDEATADQESAEVAYDPGPGWHLDWSDEFNGNSLNTSNWNVLNSNYDPVTNNCNFGTGELEYPRASNVSVSGA